MKKESIQKLINEEVAVLIDFYTDWCQPCKAMNPILEEVEMELKGQAKIIKVNVEENEAFANQLNIKRVPTFVFFNKGKLIWTLEGMHSSFHLIKMIREVEV